MNGRIAAIAIYCAATLALPAVADPPKIDAALRARVIDGALAKLKANYVFPEVADKMEKAVREKQARKEYDGLDTGPALARRLTDDLQDVSHDLHLRVLYSERPRPAAPTGGPSPATIAREQRWMTTVNYGFEKIERLPGNLGYIDLRGFLDPAQAGETCAAAMNFLAGTDALILDLRRNGGGDPAMVAVLCSYFFAEPTHLNDLYFRPDNSTRQYWTLPYVPGKRYLDKPVYVLTSKRTFSGAEECSYNLQTQKRATLIGETTGGGAHPGGPEPIDDHFAVWVPQGRAINPITKDNWEGRGVIPEVKTPAAKALLIAQKAALETLIPKTDDPDLKSDREGALKDVERELARFQSVTLALKGYADAARVSVVGTFNHWDERTGALARTADGWSAAVDLPPGRHLYQFVVDGKRVVDPANAQKAEFDGSARSVLLLAEK